MIATMHRLFRMLTHRRRWLTSRDGGISVEIDEPRRWLIWG